MPILFSVVARGNIVLARHADCVGNFGQVTDQVLAQMQPELTPKLTYANADYLFHYIHENEITYLCITDNGFDRSRAFAFLNDIKKQFQMTYGDRALTALPFAMNYDFSGTLRTQMKYYSEDQHSSALSRAQDELDELTDIMVKNIDSLMCRGEKLELLVNKTQDLESSSMTFRVTSRNLARSFWWKNVRVMVFLFVVVALVIYIIGAIACGGASWPSCVK